MYITYSFNPYFNGSSTSTNEENILCQLDTISFNPYFNGSSTSTYKKPKKGRKYKCFNPYFNGSSTSTRNILV